MSFASGLFSFAGGVSTGLREEIDLSNQRKSDKAIADALAIKEQKEADEDARRFGVTTGLEKRKVTVSELEADIKSKKQIQEEYEFRQTNKRALNKLEFEKKVHHDKFNLEYKIYLLDRKNIEEKLKLAKDDSEREKTELSLKVLEQNWNQKQDEIQNQFDIDDLDFKKYKLQVETHQETLEAMDEASKGIINFGKGLNYNKGSFKPKEQPTAFLSWMENNLTEKVIDSLPIEKRKDLLTEYNIASIQFTKDSFIGQDGVLYDFAEGSFDNAFKMGVYLGGLPLKDLAKQSALEQNQNADDALVELDANNNMQTIPFNYDEIAKDYGFESGTELKESLDSLVNLSTKPLVSKAGRPYTYGLHPFESRTTILSFLKTGTEQRVKGFSNKNGIRGAINPLVLKLSKYFNRVQEVPYGKISNSVNWDDMIDEAFSIGVLSYNENTQRVEGEEDLIDFMYMVQPELEYVFTDSGAVQKPSKKLEKYDLVKINNAEDAVAQNDAAMTARQTIKELINVLTNEESDKIGASLNIAALQYGLGNQLRLLEGVWSGVTNTKGTRLNTDNLSDTTKETVKKEINNAYKILDGNDVDAKKKARLTLLKFSLAYQVSMALQGGSGGRTISDQDVENILKSLAMSDKFFSTDTEASTLASLSTLDEYLETIELRTRYRKQGTMKGYRASQAAGKIINAIINRGGTSGNLELLPSTMEERNALPNEEEASSNAFNPSEYNKTWSIRRATNGTPIYVELNTETGTKITGSEKYIPQEIYSKMAEQINEIENDTYSIISYDENEKPIIGSTPVFNILGQD